MGKIRIEKVQELIKQEVSKIILQDLKDPHIGFVTVTSVEVTGDLKNAKIFVTFMGERKQQEDTFKALKRAKGFIRREIGKRIRLQYTPDISFHFDETFQYGVHINELLTQIHTGEVKENALEFTRNTR